MHQNNRYLRLMVILSKLFTLVSKNLLILEHASLSVRYMDKIVDKKPQLAQYHILIDSLSEGHTNKPNSQPFGII